MFRIIKTIYCGIQTVPVIFETKDYFVHNSIFSDKPTFDSLGSFITARTKKATYTISDKESGIAIVLLNGSKEKVIRICRLLQSKNFTKPFESNETMKNFVMLYLPRMYKTDY